MYLRNHRMLYRERSPEMAYWKRRQISHILVVYGEKSFKYVKYIHNTNSTHANYSQCCISAYYKCNVVGLSEYQSEILKEWRKHEKCHAMHIRIKTMGLKLQQKFCLENFMLRVMKTHLVSWSRGRIPDMGNGLQCQICPHWCHVLDYQNQQNGLYVVNAESKWWI